MKLLVNAIAKFICGLMLVGLLIFLPAGSLKYFNGWLLIGVMFVPMLFLGAILFFKSPSLLEKRLDVKEKEESQKAIVALSALLFLGGFFISGFDYRFGWSKVPLWCVITGAVAFLFSYLIYAEVVRENTYLSRIVKVEKDQKIIDHGLYGIVRHPMYMSTVFMFVSVPIILGSWFSLIIFLHYPIIIVVRILCEEKLLEKELSGYKEYKQKVKYRLIPFIW